MTNPFATMSRQRLTALIVAGLAIVLLIIVGVIQMMRTTPQRTLDQFITALNNHDQAAALSFVSTDIKPYKRENIQYFIEDWTSATTLSINKTREASWRDRVRQEKNDKGEMVDKLNQNGDRDKEIKPAARYWAHDYDADITVTYDNTEDPVTVVLRRTTNNSWSPFAQVFRGWEIVQIKYQPLPEADLEVLDQADPSGDANANTDTTTGGEFQEFSAEDNVEIDKDGNIIVNGKKAGEDTANTVPADDTNQPAANQ
jgi:hypothetical protein